MSVLHFCRSTDLYCSGLGVGIAASAFAQQGYTVDIVEIDPLVYRAAADHFGLVASPNGTVNIEDGAAYVKAIAKQRRAGKYDGQKWNLVVQDCFTGGSVPGEMFTREFWADLKENVAEDGVVAMVSWDVLTMGAMRWTGADGRTLSG